VAGVKNTLAPATLAFVLSWSPALLGQPLTLPQPSPAATVSQTIGITDVTVSYHRPSVLKREIWGTLVPYGFNDLGFGTSKAAPWRAGANETTLVTFQHDVVVAGSPLPAGTYGLFMAPAADGTVTVIFSHDTGSWGSFFYDPAHDALRANVKWEDAPFREQLSYDFTEVTKDSAVLALSWEKKRIPIPIKVQTNDIVVASLKQELSGAKGFQSQSWVTATGYLLSNNLDTNLALDWSKEAVSGRTAGERNFNTLSNEATVLEKMGKPDEAKPLMDEALKTGTAVQIHQYARFLLTMGRKERALEVFKLNAQLHPDAWPVNYGLARGYSAAGDYKTALGYLEKAQTQLPAGDTLNGPAIKINLEKLRQNTDIN
jgi:tetratricopeptide (TPR) repeat protein